jgi:1,4-alpha-glucan branching enzyme
MLRKTTAPNPGKMLVTFEFPGWLRTAQVSLVGDFNDWNKTRHPMKQSMNNRNWNVTIELDADRSYEFCYLLDGTAWAIDYHADGYVANG